MSLEVRELLRDLCALSGPSGFEGPVARRAVELLRPLVDEVYLDRFGNAVGIRRCNNPEAKTLLLDAHLDEIGLMVTGAEDGFLRFRTIGGVDQRILPDCEVTILTDPPRFGVVACLPPHLQKAGDQDRAIPLEELWIDTGLSQAEAEREIPVGTPVVFRGGCFPLGEGLMCGKAMDDRACFAALLRAAALLQDEALDVNLLLLGSGREEIGGMGAQVAAFALAPDCCVAVDVTHGKTPDTLAGDYAMELGGGPAIGLGPNMNRWMSDRLFAKAKECGIPVQTEVSSGHSGTNAWEVQVAREGIATAVLSLPLKYMHSPVEVLDLADLEATARLLAAFVRGLGEEVERRC